MAFQFPDNPAANPEVTLGNVTYKWDGEKWVAEPAGVTAPDLQAVTDQGSTTTTGATFGGNLGAADATFTGDIDADNYRIDQLPSITTA